MFIKKIRLSVASMIISVSVGLGLVIHKLDNHNINKDPKEIKPVKETVRLKEHQKQFESREEIYFQEVLTELKRIGLEETILEVTKNKSDVLLAATISCKLKEANLNTQEIKKTIASDPRAKANTEKEKIVLNTIIDKALNTYCP